MDDHAEWSDVPDGVASSAPSVFGEDTVERLIAGIVGDPTDIIRRVQPTSALLSQTTTRVPCTPIRTGRRDMTAPALRFTAAPGSIVFVRDESWLVTAVEQAADGFFVHTTGLSELVR